MLAAVHEPAESVSNHVNLLFGSWTLDYSVHVNVAWLRVDVCMQHLRPAGCDYSPRCYLDMALAVTACGTTRFLNGRPAGCARLTLVMARSRASSEDEYLFFDEKGTVGQAVAIILTYILGRLNNFNLLGRLNINARAPSSGGRVDLYISDLGVWWLRCRYEVVVENDQPRRESLAKNKQIFGASGKLRLAQQYGQNPPAFIRKVGVCGMGEENCGYRPEPSPMGGAFLIPPINPSVFCFPSPLPFYRVRKLGSGTRPLYVLACRRTNQP